jgi:eukaryotic-like serine/threonine-protein kinase
MMSNDEKSSWAFAEGEELAPGRHVSRLLGGGRRYEAYLAWDDELHTLVVVKIVRPALVDHPVVLDGLASEAHALRSLAHPIVVRAFDAVLDGDRPHLVLEYLDGPRLSTLIRRYGVILEQLLPLVLELCSGLHYLHGRGYLHLDVKPRNVVMSAQPRLIDLSIAATVEDARALRHAVGTDAYMAPEQCVPARFAELGPPTDIWGLGATVYEALARRSAFMSSADERHPQLRSRPAPLPKSVPPELAAVVLACLEPNTRDRPSAAELAALVEPWSAALPGPRLGLFRPGSSRQRSAYAFR